MPDTHASNCSIYTIDKNIRKLRKRYEKKLLTILLATLVSLTSITGCGNSEPVAETSEINVTQPETNTEDSAEMTVEDTTPETTGETESAEALEEEPTEAEAASNDEEVEIEEPVVYEGIDMESTLPGVKWIEASFPGIIDSPKLVVFNDATNRKTIVEDGQKVVFHKDDVLAIYSPEGMSTISSYDFKVFKEAYLHEMVMELKIVEDRYWDKEERETENIVNCSGQTFTLTCTLEFED